MSVNWCHKFIVSPVPPNLSQLSPAFVSIFVIAPLFHRE